MLIGELKSGREGRKGELFNCYLVAAPVRMLVFGLFYYSAAVTTDNSPPQDFDFADLDASIHLLLAVNVLASFVTKVTSQIAIRTKFRVQTSPNIISYLASERA